ncbi:MAG: thiamin pyrophosphokinase [Armatimonadetes bacterium RBG_16_58_9]|nr:MAG: thiamin pyrophosphokinase [Armatimonadetes bacterium RBG_16_58_9]
MHVTGTLRLDKRTKDLAKRLRPGDIALIDHEDIDSTAAQMLRDAKVAGVINASKSCSGRYPNLGPIVLLEAGIPILDNAGDFLFKGLREGEQIELRDGAICRNGEPVTNAEVLTLKQARQITERARENLSSELETFAENTLTYVSREKSLLLDPTALPDVETAINGRHALVVVRGESYKDDLAIIRSYINDMRPVLIGVDGGADALIELGLRPHVIVGDMDSVTDTALKCGAELIVHGYANGEAPGKSRLEKLGLGAKVCAVPGTSEDLALLLAYEKGAELIVAVGTHSHLIDFLDKGRKGMSSTFLVRLKVGNRLVDAKGVSKLYRTHPPIWRPFTALALAALVVIGTVFLLSPTLRERVQAMSDELRSQFWHLWVRLRMWER